MLLKEQYREILDLYVLSMNLTQQGPLINRLKQFFAETFTSVKYTFQLFYLHEIESMFEKKHFKKVG